MFKGKFLGSNRIRMTLICAISIFVVFFFQAKMKTTDEMAKHTMNTSVVIFGWYLANRTATHMPKFGGVADPTKK